MPDYFTSWGQRGMARINIEECWWSDPRRSLLIRLLGDEEKADGTAVKMWRLAQEFWKRDRQCVPKYIFETLQFASELLRSALAEERDGSIYVRGSSQYLEWVKDKSEAGRLGGLKSAEARREKYGNAQPQPRENTEANTEAPPKHPKQTEPSASASGFKELNTEHRKRRSNVKSDFDLENLYQGYPRKRGKIPGLEKLAKEIKTDADYLDLAEAIKNYAAEVVGREEQHILYFSTFAGQWRDWIQVESSNSQFSINTTPISLEAS
jgi:hypothetical protein